MQKADEEKMAPKKYLVISLLFVAMSAFIESVACDQKNKMLINTIEHKQIVKIYEM